MKLTKFALDRPVTILMTFLGVVLIGFISWQRLPLELLPSINYPQISVITPYENAAPGEIESLISRPIEEAVGTVKGVRRISSVSREGISLVTLDFAWGVNTDLSALDVREKIDVLKDALPRDAGNPIIVKFDPSSLPVMTLGVSGQVGLPELTRIASDEIKQKLERIAGVALARLSGSVEREISVAVDQARLFAYNIPISDVVEKVKEANFNFPGGKIERSKSEILIRTIGQFERLDQLNNVVIARRQGQTPVFLHDVATVHDTFKEQTSSFRINGEKSIGISIFKQADSNTVGVANEVGKLLEQLQKELSPRVNISVIYNQATFIKDAIADLQWAGMLGAILAFLVLLLFLRSFRTATIIVTAIPISVLGAFALMYMAGITLNIMSLGGLALGVGLLVDNGIVILENIHRQKQHTPNIYEAALTGADEMQNPVLASTLAHIIVFLPIIFVRGMTGHFFYQLALTISFSLLISILVALLLNPMLEARRLSARGSSAGSHQVPKAERSASPQPTGIKEPGETGGGMVLKTLWRKMEDGMQATERGYLQLLRYSLVNRKRVLLVTLAVLLLSLALVPVMGKEFLPQVDQGTFSMKVVFPAGTTLEATDNRAMQIWKVLAEEPEVKDVFVTIGYDRKEKVEQALGAAEPNVANVTVVLAEERRRSVEEVVETVRPKLAKISDAQIEFVLSQDVTQLLRQKQSAPEILEIKGGDLKVIAELSQEVGNQLKKIPFIEDIKSSLGVSEPEIQISVDRQDAARFQLTVEQIADTVKIAMEGEVATQFRQGEDVDIVVRLRDQDRQDVSSLENILIHTPLGSNVPLRSVANIAKTTRLREIQRRDLSRIAVVSANIVGITAGEALGKIQKVVKKIKVPPEHSITISAQHGEMAESFRSLSFALVLSVLLVYMLLASLFESFLYPFIIMFSVPLAVVGVILLLFVTGTSISLGVYIGGIMLGGIVVNNSIILVDYTNTLRKKGSSREEAVIEGGRARLRPILMTALTTILGLLPLAVGIGKGAEMRSPLAITVIGGLTTSTFMTLIVVPVIYSLFEEMRTGKFRGKR